jgi:hypothetical protein
LHANHDEPDGAKWDEPQSDSEPTSHVDRRSPAREYFRP